MGILNNSKLVIKLVIIVSIVLFVTTINVWTATCLHIDGSTHSYITGGNVGIGITQPGAKLDIDAEGSDYALRIATGTTELIIISSTGVINMKGNKIIGLAAPTDAGDGATKSYVDASGEQCALGTATEADIKEGKTADIDCDGVAEVGTMPTRTLSNANDTVNAGYYEATTLSAVDTDLAPANIVSGITIFGKAGTATVATGDANVEDVKSPRTFSKTGQASLTGTMPTQTLSNANETVQAGYYEATTLSEVDTDLAPANIASGITIFGFTGTYSGSDHELPDTGQTASYTNTFGEDHDYQPSASQPSYTYNSDGTTTDSRTGLMWLKDANTYNSGTSQTWESALSGCESFTYANYTDWRLPNIRELESIVNAQNSSPAINTTYFTNTQSGYYWSSTTYVPDTTYAWYVPFSSGYVGANGKANNYYVRPVRGGP